MAQKILFRNDAQEKRYVVTHVDAVEGLDEELDAINQNFEEVKGYIDDSIANVEPPNMEEIMSRLEVIEKKIEDLEQATILMPARGLG